jgi:pimeloyl-ACP methyl ester carboxylesterase
MDGRRRRACLATSFVVLTGRRRTTEAAVGNVVLVHGAWSDGSIWQRVVDALRVAGHRAVVVELPLTALADDIGRTRAEVARLDGPVVLVGHSYGGSVISDAALDLPQVSALVFVAAYVPDAGETVRELSERGADTVGGRAIRFGADGWSSIDPELFHDALGHDLPRATTRTLAAEQKPTHAACFTAPAQRGAWHDLPCAYVRSTDDHIFDPGLQQWLAERAGATLTDLAAGHLSPVSRPVEVADAIEQVLGRARVTAGTAVPPA